MRVCKVEGMRGEVKMLRHLDFMKIDIRQNYAGFVSHLHPVMIKNFLFNVVLSIIKLIVHSNL